jgi:tetratricopeptide (TPR) repeat protein
MANITNIPAPRVAFIDPKTGLIAREWYRFFLNLFTLVGSGGNSVTLDDLQTTPSNQDFSGDVANSLQQAQLLSLIAQYDQSIANLQQALDTRPADASNIQSQDNLSYLTTVIENIKQDIDALNSSPKPLEMHPVLYGSFYDTTSQTGSTTTATKVTFNSTDINGGVYIGSPTSRIYVSEAGIYNLQFSVQLQNTDTAVSDVNLWLAINGTDLVGSNGLISIPAKHGITNGHTIAGWNYYVNLAAGDYAELVWLPSAVTTTIQYYAATVGPPAIPATYSVILTMCKVNTTSG